VTHGQEMRLADNKQKMKWSSTTKQYHYRHINTRASYVSTLT